MNRQPTRTDLVEAHQDRINSLVQRGYDARTRARAYSELADLIETQWTKGPMWDVAQVDLANFAHMRSNECVQHAAKCLEEAENMKHDGVSV